MSDPFLPRVGGVLSADIAIPEYEREVRFYSRVLTTGAKPLWRDDLMNNLGMPIIGLGAWSAEYGDLPLQWMPHIQVADVAASVERALGLVGRELMHGKDDDGRSQWAVLLDPDGAAFGLIPVVPAEAVAQGEGDTAAQAGCISRIELTVPDASATGDFYRQVVGWSVQDVEAEDGPERYANYQVLCDDGSPVGTICHARGDASGLPTCWMICLPVGDLAESIRRVREEGGKVIQTRRGAADEYTYAAIQDPVGACLVLVPGE